MINFNILKPGRVLQFAAVASLITIAAASDPSAAGPARSLSRRGEIRIEPITLSNLQSYAGRDLSVLYVSARERSIGRDGQTLKVRSLMREPVKVRIDSNGVAQIPLTEVPFRRSVDGVSLAFNYMIFAVHRNGQDDVYLARDSDDSYARDPRLPGDLDYTSVHSDNIGAAEMRFVSILRYFRLNNEKSNPGAVNIDFRSDCR